MECWSDGFRVISQYSNTPLLQLMVDGSVSKISNILDYELSGEPLVKVPQIVTPVKTGVRKAWNSIPDHLGVC
jgi:hypothetical protein